MTIRPDSFRSASRPRRLVWLLLTAAGLSGCITTRIMTEPDSDTPANVSYASTTSTAYFWGLVQPTDITPPCDPRSNYLNMVAVKTTFGHYLLSTVTLGIITKRRVQWHCAPYVPPSDSI